MRAPMWGKQFLIGLALIGFSHIPLRAIEPSNVLVLYNKYSAEGVELADYYAQQYPGVRLLELDLHDYDLSEQVTADYYLNEIRPKILPALTSDTDVIVTTKGLPLRIEVTAPRPPEIPSDLWRSYSSLESELTRIDTISTQEQMGNQWYFDAGNPSLNPYYPHFPFQNANPIGPFDYNNPVYGGIRLTSRLDGFSAADVKAAIERGKNAYFPKSSWVVLDDDPSAGVDLIQPLASTLLSYSQSYVYDNSVAAVTTAPGSVIGYVSHGIHGSGLNPGYIPNQLNFSLANGAVFHTHESYNAVTFQWPENQDQGLIAEWLAKGGTAGVGNVEESLNGPANVANEDQMFKMLLDGYTWVEAAWSSLEQLSYVNTVVGDPLMTWKQPPPCTLYTVPLNIGSQEAGEYVVKGGAIVMAPEVQIGDALGNKGVLSLEGGTLEVYNSNSTLNVSVNGTFNYLSGTLDVDTIHVQGNGTSGGMVNATKLNLKTLTVEPGAKVTIAPPVRINQAREDPALISYSGRTTIPADGFLQINTPGFVELKEIIGEGRLGVGNGTSATTLVAQSIVVQKLSVSVGSKIIIGTFAGISHGPQPVNIPEPGSLLFLVSTAFGFLIYHLRRKNQ